jgi:hypothetical protein
MDRRRVVAEPSFPRVSLPSHCDGRPVEVMLIAQLAPGAGDAFIAQAGSRQVHHPAHHDALDEPSARLSAPDFALGDPTSLFSFSVGAHGHPFHCHAGNRLFTAMTGSGGAQLRFSTASTEQIAADPTAFVRALTYVNLPADCLFTVRFGGGTWHQFMPLREGAMHSAFFALSCHPDESAGTLTLEQRQSVASGQATIATLTELLPDAVAELLAAPDFRQDEIAKVWMSFDVQPESWQQRFCSRLRSASGRFRRGISLRRQQRTGFVATAPALPRVRALSRPPADSLLCGQLADDYHFEDTYSMRLDFRQLRASNLHGLLADLLQSFVEQPSSGVSLLMQLRNLAVKPLGLRTSRLGCPVSSLLSPDAATLFAGRFPVLAQHEDPDRKQLQIILGADDKHLRFRSCIGLRRIDEYGIELTMGTRVSCRNLFGHAYMAAIESVHRRYVMPALLSSAVRGVLREEPATLTLAPMQASRG